MIQARSMGTREMTATVAAAIKTDFTQGDFKNDIYL